MAVPPASPIDRASSDDRTRESSVRRVRRETLALLAEWHRTHSSEISGRAVMPGGLLGTSLGDRASTGHTAERPCRPKPNRASRPAHTARRASAASVPAVRAPRRTAGRFSAGSGSWCIATGRAGRGRARRGADARRSVRRRPGRVPTFLTLPAAHPLIDAGEPSRRLLITLTRNVARNRRRLHARAKPHSGDPGCSRRCPPPPRARTS